MSSARRRERIAEVREEARVAFESGNSRNPYKAHETTDYGQWQNAYDLLAWAAERDKADDAEAAVNHAIAAVQDANARHALELLFEFMKEKLK